MIAGALQGWIFHQVCFAERWHRGDAFVWDAIEHFAWVGSAIGLSAGIALAVSRHIGVRLTLSALLGIVAVTVALYVYSDGRKIYLWGSMDEAADELLISKPEGWGLYLGGAAAALLAGTCHLARRCEGKPKLLLLILVLGTLASIRTQSFFWGPWDRYHWRPWGGCGNSAPQIPDTPGWLGALFLTWTAFLLCLWIPLIIRWLRRSPMLPRLPLAIAGANLLCLSGLAWAGEAMPLTPASNARELVFTDYPDIIATAHDGETVRLWEVDTENGLPVARLLRKHRLRRGPFRLTSIGLSPSLIAAGSEDGRVTIWSLPSFRKMTEIEIPGKSPGCLAISKNGRYLAVANRTETVRLWELHVREEDIEAVELRSVKSEKNVYGLAFSPDGSRLAVSRDFTPSTIYDTLKATPALQYPGCRFRLSWPPIFSEGGGFLVFGSKSGMVEILDLGSRRTRILDTGLPKAMPLAFSPDGRQLAVRHDSRIWFVDLASGDLTTRPYSGDGRDLYGFSPDGTLFAAGAEDGSIQLWDLPARN